MVRFVLFALASFVLLFLEMVEHVIWLSWAAIGRHLPHNSSTFYASSTKEFQGERDASLYCVTKGIRLHACHRAGNIYSEDFMQVHIQLATSWFDYSILLLNRKCLCFLLTVLHYNNEHVSCARNSPNIIAQCVSLIYLITRMLLVFLNH